MRDQASGGKLSPPTPAPMIAALEQEARLKTWLEGDEDHHSLQYADELVEIDKIIVLQPHHERCDMRVTRVVVVTGNQIRTIISASIGLSSSKTSVSSSILD